MQAKVLALFAVQLGLVPKNKRHSNGKIVGIGDRPLGHIILVGERETALLFVAVQKNAWFRCSPARIRWEFEAKSKRASTSQCLHRASGAGT